VRDFTGNALLAMIKARSVLQAVTTERLFLRSLAVVGKLL
jgi:hypothetical protein